MSSDLRYLYSNPFLLAELENGPVRKLRPIRQKSSRDEAPSTHGGIHTLRICARVTSCYQAGIRRRWRSGRATRSAALRQLSDAGGANLVSCDGLNQQRLH